MTRDLISRARETVCGWDRCQDCGILKETIEEIERLQTSLGDLAEILMSALVFVHESIVDDVDKILAGFLGDQQTAPETPLEAVLSASDPEGEGISRTTGMRLNLSISDLSLLREAVHAHRDGEDPQIDRLSEALDVLDEHASRMFYPADLSIHFHKEHP